MTRREDIYELLRVSMVHAIDQIQPFSAAVLSALESHSFTAIRTRWVSSLTAMRLRRVDYTKNTLFHVFLIYSFIDLSFPFTFLFSSAADQIQLIAAVLLVYVSIVSRPCNFAGLTTFGVITDYRGN